MLLLEPPDSATEPDAVTVLALDRCLRSAVRLRLVDLGLQDAPKRKPGAGVGEARTTGVLYAGGPAEGALVMVDAFTVEVVEEADGVAIVALLGELDMDGARVLEEHLTRLGSQVWCVHFDASHLEFMAAAGLHCILATERRFGRGRVTVDNPPRIVRKVLATCELLHLLQG